MRLFHARLEGPTFTFDAYDVTALKAEKVLLKLLVKHGKQYDLPANWWVGKMDYDVTEFALGSGYRDRELVK